MNAKQFLILLNKGNFLQTEDFEALERLHEPFPYFSIPHILAAKYEMRKSKGESLEFLHWASIQSVNRARLKKLIEKDIDFLSLQAEGLEQGTSSKGIIDLTIPEKGGYLLLKEQDRARDIQNREEILKRLENNLNRFTTRSQSPPEEKPGPLSGIPSEKRREPEDLIETIKKKEKKEIRDVRKKEQNDLIKAFSKKTIRLAASRENEDAANMTDLSRTSTLFNDNIISEAFAKLLVRQNKKEKAAEIYQKLILKFPDKSAYFADLIRELEEKNK